MKLGIICPMKIEAEAIKAAMADVTVETVGGIEYTVGTIGSTEIVCAVCGVGKVFAGICAQTMIIRYAPDAIINTGVGGSLSRKLNIGDVAVSDFVVQHDMDTSPLGDPVGLISGLDLIHIPADEKLGDAMMSILADMGIHCIKGTIASGDQFVASPEEKTRISETFNAVVCEMEGGAVGQVCAVNHVPFCVIRAVSDNADTGAVEDFPTFAANVANKSANAVITLAGGMR